VQVLLKYQPACLEDMWRCGALPGLVVSVAKAMDWQGQEAGSAEALLQYVLHAAPSFAITTERQQFVLLVLARFGGPAAAQLLQQHSNSSDGTCQLLFPRPQSGSESLSLEVRLAFRLPGAAKQLGGQPLLRQQLEAAAPALLPAADAVLTLGDDDIVCSDPDPDHVLMTLKPEPLQLLVALGQQLDPLALGLRLPGCYNSACTSLAGASEAAMVLKTCAGCRVAR